MAIATTTILAVSAIAGAAAATYGAVQSSKARKEASSNAAKAAQEEALARNEQKAGNAQSAAAERRSQVREERVRRARILQAAENSGAGDSSGEFGAVGGMATQLQANIGMNLGKLQSANTIGGYLQNAADFTTAAQRSSMQAQNADQLFSLGMSIFSSAGGFKAL